MLSRNLSQFLQNKLFCKKALIITGARQTGKTTLIKMFLESNANHKTLFLNCDEPDVRSMLTNPTSTMLSNLIGNAEIVAIDEAQRVENIGVTLKLLVDNFPQKQIVVSLSSAIGLHDTVNETLTGRKYEYKLYPFSFGEIVESTSLLDETRNLNQRLIFGSYPDVVQNPSDAQEIVKNLASSYLYKDVFSLANVKKPLLLESLTQLLALQIGSEVSYNELASNLCVDISTVQAYINLLEENSIVFRLPSYSKNVRNEIKKSRKVYFWDLGIRNALIGNFRPVEMREDKGALWENYLISERLKKNIYEGSDAKSFFWRTTQKQEIDYIEEDADNLSAFEFKWNANKKPSAPLTFSRAYPESVYSVVNRDNYAEFLLGL